MDIQIPDATTTFTGAASGYATVSDNTPFYPGAEVFLCTADNTTIRGQRAIITDLSSTTLIGIRFVNEFPTTVPSYIKNSLAAFTAGSTIHQPVQTVRVEEFSPIKLPKV